MFPKNKQTLGVRVGVGNHWSARYLQTGWKVVYIACIRVRWRRWPAPSPTEWARHSDHGHIVDLTSINLASPSCSLLSTFTSGEQFMGTQARDASASGRERFKERRANKGHYCGRVVSERPGREVSLDRQNTILLQAHSVSHFRGASVCQSVGHHPRELLGKHYQIKKCLFAGARARVPPGTGH